MLNKPWFKVIVGFFVWFLLMFFWSVALGVMGLDGDWVWMPLIPFVLSILSYLLMSFTTQYNKVIHLKQEIASSFYAIEIKENHVKKLISQLQEVTDKIVDHELKMSIKKTVSELVENEKTSENMTSDEGNAYHDQKKKKFDNHSGSSNKHDNYSQMSDKVTKLVERIERDTNGSADQSLRDLMAEIKEAEALVTNQRLYHNQTVSDYNKAIYALPFAFLRTTLGHSEQFYV